MSKQHLIAASVLSADFARLGAEIKAVEHAGVDWIHFDITDGHFVQNLTMGTLAVAAAKRTTHLPLDVHLMIENPERFIGMFADCGATHISVHYEEARHLYRLVQIIREAKVHPGVALGPTTPLSSLEWVLDYIDYVLLVSVSPGFGGQRYIPHTMERIKKVKEMIEASGRDILIQADGGINLETIALFTQAGTNVHTVGSALFKSADYHKTVERMRTVMKD
ncbi:MAG: ribulose-phosphate 3-epimerase [Sphaerochaetaceae bacterium]|nr:ribulose-phosphate 3-epimerase [Sphaerochaetaceae bacterium]